MKRRWHEERQRQFDATNHEYTQAREEPLTVARKGLLGE
jgi:hypothetical protein